jgi:outer membrane protein insertion porin family
MKKKIIAVVLLTLFITVGAFADETSWYDGLKISNFQTNGIQNVKESEIDNILFQYRNKSYSVDLFNEIQSKLYAVDGVSYFYSEAIKENEDANTIILSFNFFEKQLLNKITFSGNSKLVDSTLLEESDLILNSFYNGNEMSFAKEKIQSAYDAKGYSDAIVVPTLIEDGVNNTVAIDFEVKEGKQIIVTGIGFDGNDAYSSDVLKKQITSKVKSFFTNGYFSAPNVAKDIQALKSFYNENGYIQSQITGPTKEVVSEDDSKERVNLVFQIEEGNIWKFGKLNVSGNTVFSTEELTSQITLKEGDVFDSTSWQNSIMKISDLYYNMGYINFTFDPKQNVDMENNIISLDLQITEGVRVRVVDFIFNGLGDTNPEVFRRELTLKAGDYFSKEAIQKSFQNIQNTQLVTDLNFQVIPLGEGECNIEIDLVQSGQRDIQFGATFGGATDNEFPISALFTLTERNVFGTGNDMSFSTTLAPKTQKASISYTDEYFGEIPWSNTFSLSAQHKSVKDVLALGTGGFFKNKDESAYPKGYSSYSAYKEASEATPDSSDLMSYSITTFAAGYSTGYTFKFDPGNLTLSTGLNISINKANFEDNDLPFDFLLYQYGQSWCFSNKYSLGFAWDGRDLINNTTKGYYITQNFTYAGGILGGISNYIKSSTSFAAYRPVYEWSKDDKTKKVIGSYSTNLSLMLPQYSKDTSGTWVWSDATYGATASEMLYIDGTTIALGHNSVQNQSVLFDNKASLEYSIVDNLVSWDTFISATGISPDNLWDDNFNMDWYFAAGTGLKIKIPGFPLGLYLVKNATILNSEDAGFAFNEKSSLFDFSDDGKGFWNGVNLVLSISTSLF